MNPKLGPPVPKEERDHSRRGASLREVVVGVLPLLGLIAATLGSILGGSCDADGGRRHRQRSAR